MGFDQLGETEDFKKRNNVVKENSNNVITYSSKSQDNYKRNGVLANEVAETLNDWEHLSSFQKLASQSDHNLIREALSITKHTIASKKIDNKGAYFYGVVKNLIKESESDET